MGSVVWTSNPFSFIHRGPQHKKRRPRLGHGRNEFCNEIVDRKVGTENSILQVLDCSIFWRMS